MPPQSAYGAEPGPIDGMGSGDPTAAGSPFPVYQLEDFQPDSCGHEAVYGLDVFNGTVTMAALLAGW